MSLTATSENKHQLKRKRKEENSIMSSLMGSHGMALATATAMAVSGTVLIVALCRPKPMSVAQTQTQFGPCYLRPCITSGERKRRKDKKKVRFGEDVVVEFDSCEEEEEGEMEAVFGASRFEQRVREMPENRAALYTGMMQDRLQRMACY